MAWRPAGVSFGPRGLGESGGAHGPFGVELMTLSWKRGLESLSVMTTFPAEAMLGRLPWTALVWALLGSFLFAFFSRRVWLHSIGRYTSASS